MSNNKDVLEKIQKLKNLKDAINLVRSMMKAEQKPQLDNKIQQLKHLGMHELAHNVISHVIGTGMPETHHYRADEDYKKKHEGVPHVSVDVVDHAGRVLGKSPKMYSNIKEAVSDIVHHYHKKAWKDEEQKS